MNKVFGYARVSTQDQNLDTQIEVLEKHGCNRIFQEKITGISTSRPALDEMLSLLREGDTVVVARFFRLGRSRDHLINVVNSLAQQGVIFKALDLGIDTSSISGKFVINLFAALSEFDRESILEKTKAGQILARQKGKHCGRPAGINEENFKKVKMAHDKGFSVKEIVELTKISSTTVKRYRKLINQGAQAQ